MRRPSLMGRIVFALALVTVGALIAGPAVRAVGDSGAPEPAASANATPHGSPSPSPSRQPSPSPSSPAPSHDPDPAPPVNEAEPSEPAAPQEGAAGPGRGTLERTADVVEDVADAVEVSRLPHSRGCMIEIGGVGPLNICI